MKNQTIQIVITKDNSIIAKGSITNKCIHSIDILPEYQHQGYGKTILKQLIKLGGNWLWVNINNSPAISLYTQFNFQIIDQTNDFYKMKLRKIIND